MLETFSSWPEKQQTMYFPGEKYRLLWAAQGCTCDGTKNNFPRFQMVMIAFCTFRYLYGKPDTPKATTDVVTAVSTLLAPFVEDKDNGWEKAVQILESRGDLVTGRQLARNDWYRLARALEILMVHLQNIVQS